MKGIVAGRTWTTDAVYRETSGKAEKLRKEGCIAVEMELAGSGGAGMCGSRNNGGTEGQAQI